MKRFCFNGIISLLFLILAILGANNFIDSKEYCRAAELDTQVRNASVWIHAYAAEHAALPARMEDAVDAGRNLPPDPYHPPGVVQPLACAVHAATDGATCEISTSRFPCPVYVGYLPSGATEVVWSRPAEFQRKHRPILDEERQHPTPLDVEWRRLRRWWKGEPRI